MLFNSFPFVLLFLPAALLGFHATAAIRRAAARAWLAAISLLFYIWWYPPFGIVIVCSILFNYTAALAIRSDIAPAGRRSVLAFAIAANLAALFYYKYSFAVVVALFRMRLVSSFPLQEVILPLGISFYTFTQIGYLLDSKAAIGKRDSFVDYVLFVTFFPHLIAGPILHHKEIMPQFADDRAYRFDLDNLLRGLGLFIIGMLKKVAIADYFAPLASDGFAIAGLSSATVAWGSALCYSIQLYFDFSGYSDMAVGIARMFNIRFPINFNSPYKSTSIIDFWARWHMTLTRYLNQYLFNPLAVRATRRLAAAGKPVNRQALAKPGPFYLTVVQPILVTMTLAGIWHGAGLQFLAFGLLHAGYLVCNHAWRTFGPKPSSGNEPAHPARLIAYGAITYLAVLVAQVFFRAASVGDAVAFLEGMAGQRGLGSLFVGLAFPSWLPGSAPISAWLVAHGLAPSDTLDSHAAFSAATVAWLALAYAVVWLAPNSQTIMGVAPLPGAARSAAATAPPEPRGFRFRYTLPWSMALGAFGAFALLEIAAKSEFLYFQF